MKNVFKYPFKKITEPKFALEYKEINFDDVDIVQRAICDKYFAPVYLLVMKDKSRILIYLELLQDAEVYHKLEMQELAQKLISRIKEDRKKYVHD